MHFDSSNISVFRSRTSRTNLRYQIIHRERQQYRTQGLQEEAHHQWFVQQIRQKRRQFSSGKTIVYCSTISQTRQLGTLLECPIFHSKIPDKDMVLQNFRKTTFPVIAATSALGMGVDIPDIHCIFHLDRPRTLLDYTQESGRAGRDGERSDVVILLPLDSVQSSWQQSEEAERQLMDSYLSSTCRQVILDQYLDGHQRRQCESDEEPCDRCEPERDVEPDISMDEEQGQQEDEIMATSSDSEDSESSSSESENAEIGLNLHTQRMERQQPHLQQQTQDQEDPVFMEELCQRLTNWNQRCNQCVQGGWTSGHNLLNCAQPLDPAKQQQARKLKKTIRYDRFSGCFECGLPQEICDMWVDNGHGGFRKSQTVKCQYPDELASGFISAATTECEILKWKFQIWMKENGVEMHDTEIFAFMGKRVPFKAEVNNLTWTYNWMLQVLEQEGLDNESKL